MPFRIELARARFLYARFVGVGGDQDGILTTDGETLVTAQGATLYRGFITDDAGNGVSLLDAELVIRQQSA